MRVGIAHHFGWAVAVTANAVDEVVDRRRIELIEPGMPTAPIHHEGKRLADEAVTAMAAAVRASAARATSAALVDLAAAVAEPIGSLSIRAWPDDFPTDIATLRRSLYEARADSVMYLEVLAASARDLGRDVRTFDAKTVEAQARKLLGDRADDVLHGPRSQLGPPWNSDHRTALAATILAARSSDRPKS